MNKKKTIIAAVVLMLVLLVGGLIAYFTDTETATNTFTIGNVDITLTEPLWDALTDQNNNDIPDAAENMMPGDEVTKDPTIKNVSTTNPAYVFAEVVIPCVTDNRDATPAYIPMFTLGQIGSGWNLMTDGACTLNATTNKYEATKVYNYGTASAMTSLAANTAAPAVFSKITLNELIDNDKVGKNELTGNKDVVVNGYGIQTTNLSSTAPADIFANFNN